jgi:hypothetical protein
MLGLEFSEADKHALNHERYHHPHPRVQQRMEALWLKSQGLPHHRIATLCAISGNTLEPISKPQFSPLFMRVWGGLEIGS